VLAAGYGWPPRDLMRLTWREVAMWLDELDRMQAAGDQE
jgi:hypothetical protein